jgi:hypothetical protein
MVRSEGNMSPKNPVTTWGIDPGTVRIVAQRLNHYATPGPRKVQNWQDENGEVDKDIEAGSLGSAENTTLELIPK